MLHYYCNIHTLGDSMSDSFIAYFVPSCAVSIAKFHTAIVQNRKAVDDYIRYRKEIIQNYSLNDFLSEVIHAAS